jgi:hypothetical protein
MACDSQTLMQAPESMDDGRCIDAIGPRVDDAACVVVTVAGMPQLAARAANCYQAAKQHCRHPIRMLLNLGGLDSRCFQSCRVQ